MQKFTVTKVSRLSIGDRFYKQSDHSKKVLEMVQGHIVRTRYQTYGFWCKADGDTEAKAINKKTPVVFLRHNENGLSHFSYESKTVMYEHTKNNKRRAKRLANIYSTNQHT